MPVRRCLAHVSEDGSEQSVEAHLEGTAALAAGFAAPFGAGAQGRFVGLAHDIGKYSEAFQRRLLENGRKVDHATAGAVECARLGAEWAAFCVAGHHGGLPDGGSTLDDAGCSTLMGRLKRGLSGGIPDYSAWPGSLPPSTPPALWGRDPLTDSFFVRMLYSCLVDGDYLDTEAFLRAAPPPRGGHDPLPVLLERLEGHISGWWPPKTDLNRRRCQILRACLDGGDRPRGLYTLTVPTGGGKTVASLAFALRHAIANGLDRVIYIIPYTSIIEQNAAVFRDILGEGNVVEHHSGVNWDPEDETAPAQYRQTLAAENFDAPVVVTTAVQFFESLYASRPSQCRKLHNCSNSVLIFDEAQMLPLEHLRPCVAAIAQLVAHFRSTAVLCTATQPALEAQFRAFAPALPIQELCPGTSDLYEHFRRVTFARAGRLSREALAERLAAQPQALCIVNSRKSAGALYRLLPPEHRFHLSTLMFPVHRRAVLDQVRRRLKNGLPCRVVSTSLIEAGVDVDFPAVWREEAGLDSILQAAGRCNREGRRPPQESTVTVFQGEEAPPPLFRRSIGAAREALSDGADPARPETVRRYFLSLLDLSGPALDRYGVLDAFQRGSDAGRMPFRSVSERFHLIDSPTKTVYIPLDGGVPLTDRLRAGERSQALFRQLGQYGVSLYDQHYQALRSAGDLEELEDGTAVLANLSLYSRETGLSLDADFGKGLFV